MRFVSVKNLKPGMIVAKGLTNSSKTFMIKENIELTQQYINRLTEAGYAGLYIKDKISDSVQIMDTIAPELFAEGVEAVKNQDIGALVEVSKVIVSEVLYSDNICADILDLRSYDDYTYHHSVNVALYSTLIGKRMNLSAMELEMLCQAGICHDLGKSKIDASIITKPDKLTDEEFELIKNHPRYSYEILSGCFNISAKVKQAVLYHHENEEGTGYPEGLKGEEIPLFAKILHAVDVYDALTSKRPYKEPFTPAEALQYIDGGKGILFDKDVVEVMMKVIPAYPPGIDVTLSNGEECLCIAHTRNALRPRVRVIERMEDVNLMTDRRYKDIDIVESSLLPANSWAEDIEKLNQEKISALEHASDKTILVVDDSVTSLMTARSALEDRYNLVLVKNAMHAMAYVRKNPAPDLVLMDIEMPDLDGITCMRKLREISKVPDIPVIFCTSIINDAIKNQCRLINAVEYITKPIRPIYLRERVAIFFGESRE
ncbi:MAG: response regulator [Eubacterium sp.]|nr:response regulator [Eubacterium sp.]